MVVKKVYVVCALMAAAMIFSLDAKKTKKLQVIINYQDPAFSTFALNAGDGISNNPSSARPFGSYVIASGLIFPQGTVSKNQSSYLVDKYGNTLLASDSLGRWQAFEKMIATFDPMNFPAPGTLLHMSEWGMYFNDECQSEPNNLNLFGTATIQSFAFWNPLFIWQMTMMAGTGCNTKANKVTGKLYIGAEGGVLLKLTFEDDIKY